MTFRSNVEVVRAGRRIWYSRKPETVETETKPNKSNARSPEKTLASTGCGIAKL